MMRIAMVSRTGDVLHAFTGFCKAQGAELLHFPSIAALYRQLPELVISGLIIDMPLLVRAVDTEKFMLQAIEAVFPSIRANWHVQVGFQALFHDSGRSGEENLAAFLQHCRNFPARALRKDRRTTKHFNVLFWLDGTPEQSALRAYTSDISRGGLFVCTCDPPPDVASLVWVRLRELDEQPCKVVVRWTAPWGTALRVPGFGGMFVDLPDVLIPKIEAVLR